MASRGWAFPEVESAFNRARSLCEQMGEVPQLAPVLWGIWGFYAVRGEFQTALKAGEGSNDRSLLTAARYVLAVSHFWLGELEQAQSYFKELDEGFELEQHRSLVALFGLNCGIVGKAYAGYPWFLGYPDRACARIAQAVTMAQEVSHPESIAWALLCHLMVHQLCGNIAQALATSEKVIEYCNEHGLVMQSAIAGMIKAWAFAVQGETELGITMLRQGLEALRAPGLVLMESAFRVMLADAYLRAGKPEEGLLSLQEELAGSRSEERNFEAELARLRGAPLLERTRISGLDLSDEAAECFRRAIEIARRQSAKSWELRATMSLARLLASQGRRDEARMMLAEIYNWFTEGFDTADLKDAKALLEEL
jgi:predicted ATPase